MYFIYDCDWLQIFKLNDGCAYKVIICTGGPLLTRVPIARFLITRVLKRVLKISVNTIFFQIPLLARSMLLIDLLILNCQPEYNVSG